MHSRCFKVAAADDREKDLDLKARTLYSDDAMDIPVADYIDDMDEKAQEEDRQDFLHMPGIHAVTRNIFKVDKSEYFKGRYESLRSQVAELTPEEFSGKTPKGFAKLYEIKSTIDDQCGYYIYTSYADTMDNWVRDAEEDKEYELGSVLDYHF